MHLYKVPKLIKLITVLEIRIVFSFGGVRRVVIGRKHKVDF